ncbi:MAG: hypothetical protein ACT4O1_08425 [Gemmatimonadota bacterium]
MIRTFTFTFMFTCTACSVFQPQPQIITRVDTVTITREVVPPLPVGDTAEVCLSTGMSARVLVAANGDTLIGDARVRLSTVRPVLAFAGAYMEQPADTMRFERRLYRKSGVVAKRMCDELKQVGDYHGIPVFADVTAPAALPAIAVPVKPGFFQTYTVPTPARRR